MIDCVFTIDYELYGNGEGSLRELVYEPAERLKTIFDKWNARFVVFVEAAELEMIDTIGVDRTIDLVKHQMRDFYKEGFELGLHIHPWWYNARYENGGWILDYTEYNLCILPKERIIQIVDRSIIYLQKILGVADFTPVSFRAGHLLFQPAATLASVLGDRGIKIDSSVYKGGLWRQHKIDYRRALRNGYYWRFSNCTNVPDPQGTLLELPIYTKMVPIWKMFTSKRVSLQHKRSSAVHVGKKVLSRFFDFLRLSYPLKLDLGQMTREELIRMVDDVIREDHEEPSIYRPIVAIMHTKDPIDFEAVVLLLSYLREKGVSVSNFNNIYQKVQILSSTAGVTE